MARTRQPETLFELTVARVAVSKGGDPARSFLDGIRAIPRAQKVCQYVAQWAMASNDLGKLATTAEYAEWWSIDERTGWRHRATIHEAFPGDEMRVVVEAVQEAAKGRAKLDALRVPIAALS